MKIYEVIHFQSSILVAAEKAGWKHTPINDRCVGGLLSMTFEKTLNGTTPAVLDIIINTDGSLQNYAGYSMQLKVYLEGTLGNVNQTCAVVYSHKKKKLEKRFIKTKKKFLANKDQVLRQIGTDTFTFQKR